MIAGDSKRVRKPSVRQREAEESQPIKKRARNPAPPAPPAPLAPLVPVLPPLVLGVLPGVAGPLVLPAYVDFTPALRDADRWESKFFRVTFAAPARVAPVKHCKCCRERMPGKCGEGHNCTDGKCFVRVCKTSLPPPTPNFSGVAASTVASTVKTSAEEWALLRVLLHAEMRKPQQTCTKTVTVSRKMSSLFWAMFLGERKSFCVRFAQCAALDGILGAGWNVIHTRGVKSSTIEVDTSLLPVTLRSHMLCCRVKHKPNMSCQLASLLRCPCLVSA
jgi:hypothetical protein